MQSGLLTGAGLERGPGFAGWPAEPGRGCPGCRELADLVLADVSEGPSAVERRGVVRSPLTGRTTRTWCLGRRFSAAGVWRAHVDVGLVDLLLADLFGDLLLLGDG